MYGRNYCVEQLGPERYAAINAENRRYEKYIELIASGNYALPAVMWTQGTQLNDKCEPVNYFAKV